MMTYPDICNVNKGLYAELEHLTYEIAYCTVKGHEDIVDELTRQKDAVKELININLEELNKYWQIMDATARDARRKNNYEMLFGREKRVVDMYIRDPSTPIADIAHKFKLSIGHANRIIAQYLTKKYSEVA